MHVVQINSDILYVDWETLLADPADNSVTVVNFLAARYLSVRMSLENCADGALRGDMRWPW
eukprot:3517343-Pyramimonas_sp.AAC.1